MLQKIPAQDRYHSQEEWLSTYHLFSFANYYDPNNMNFGVLRVFNDDTIDAHSGFGEHGHKDMEIVTVVLDGELTHTDSMGNNGSIVKGEVQYMSAGTGVVHSEYNNGNEPVHLYQIWLMPQKRNMTPSYGQENFSQRIIKNNIISLATNQTNSEGIVLKSDATIYMGAVEKDKKYTHLLHKDRGLFIYIQSGKISIQNIEYSTGDQARITGEDVVEIHGKENSVFIIIDVALQYV